MSKLEAQTIRINSLNLTTGYLKETKHKRNKVCFEIVEGAFGKMTAPIGLDKRAMIMTDILNRSILALEQEEEFEEAQILLDVRNTIPEVLNKLRNPK